MINKKNLIKNMNYKKNLNLNKYSIIQQIYLLRKQTNRIKYNKFKNQFKIYLNLNNRIKI